MSKYLCTPWRYSDMGQMVFGKDDTGGEVLIAQVRGWGQLTGQGTGALGLSHGVATAIQDQRGKLLAAAPDLLEALREVEYQLADLESWEMSTNARKARTTEALTAARAAIKKAEGN